MNRVLAALAGLLVVATAGCDGDDGDDDEPAAATTTISTTTTTAVSGGPTTAAPPGPACPGPAMGVAVAEPVTIQADVDGDGVPEAATTYLDDLGAWHLRIDLVDGGALDEPLATSPADVARIESATDLDGDGAAELWSQVGTGASAVILTVHRVVACDVVPVLLDGRPAEFAVGGTVTLLQGLACTAAGLLHLGATSEDGVTYTTLDLTYELRAGELARSHEQSRTLTADDPDLGSYSDFAC